jgi:hypothetical protein
MDDEQLRAIASESEEIRSERASLEQKLSVLESGKHVLFEHMGKTSDRIFIKTYLRHVYSNAAHIPNDQEVRFHCATSYREECKVSHAKHTAQ